jgi:hypothetical protein
MTEHSVYLSNHAALRMAQRNVSLDDAALVVCYGTVEHRTGVEFYFLSQRDIPLGRERELERLVGTTVVVRRGRVQTVYRNRRALPSIKRKSKHARSWSLPHITSLSGTDLALMDTARPNGSRS